MSDAADAAAEDKHILRSDDGVELEDNHVDHTHQLPGHHRTRCLFSQRLDKA